MTQPVGAPTKYDPEFPYLQKANEYLKKCGREQTRLPKVEEFCDEELDIDDDTAVEWCKLYPKSEFSAAIKKIKRAQKGQLIDDGMYGGKEVNPGVAVFLLKVNHGMVETSHTDVTSGGKPLKSILGNELSESNSNSQAPAADKEN